MLETVLRIPVADLGRHRGHDSESRSFPEQLVEAVGARLARRRKSGNRWKEIADGSRAQNNLASGDRQMKSSVSESNAIYALFASPVQQLVLRRLRRCVHAHRSSGRRAVAR